ncbi:hypothetical protein [Nocardia sp. NPDC049707]|uniref:hypothetical protein n=1 Tax=Nocardia sp. NPDC049707 TaxID=3154735 RepID=UPI0034256184
MTAVTQRSAHLAFRAPIHGMIDFTPHGQTPARELGITDPRMMYFASLRAQAIEADRGGGHHVRPAGFYRRGRARHWIQRQRAAEVSAALIDFARSVG